MLRRIDQRGEQKCGRRTLPAHLCVGIARLLRGEHRRLSFHDPTGSEQIEKQPIDYYSLILKKYRGKSFQQYVIEIRMKYAKQLLEQTTLSVKQVAQQIGYENVSHFYHLFEKYYGKTPREIRSREG